MSVMTREETEALIQEVLEVYPEAAARTAPSTWPPTIPS